MKQVHQHKQAHFCFWSSIFGPKVEANFCMRIKPHLFNCGKEGLAQYKVSRYLYTET